MDYPIFTYWSRVTLTSSYLKVRRGLLPNLLTIYKLHVPYEVFEYLLLEHLVSVTSQPHRFYYLLSCTHQEFLMPLKGLAIDVPSWLRLDAADTTT